MDDVAVMVETAWPGQTEVYRGASITELGASDIPCTVLAVQGGVGFEPSGARAAMATVTLLIAGYHARPVDTSVNLELEQWRLADLLTEQLESQFVWADGDGVNSYITNIETGQVNEEPILFTVHTFSVEFHCTLGA